MSRSISKDVDTAPARRTKSAAIKTASRVPAFTVLWHRDVSRVGDVAVLESLVQRGRESVSRVAPLFAQPGARGGRDLDDISLSRTSPLLELTTSDGGQTIELRPGKQASPVEVQGSPLTAALRLTSAEVDRGVVVLLANEVLLCLHRLRLPIVRAEDMGLIGHSDGLECAREAVVRVADMDVPVLVRGETGTGKESIARSIVARSQRAKKPFVSVSMATIPPSVAAAELFGHARGAYTGAATNRHGLFGEAHTGTLFLDEIGTAPLDVQTMLLRVLDDGEVIPLGTARGVRFDVRIIAATDADLGTAIASRSFSKPLYERLAGYQIRLPALRERREDFGRLFLAFLRQQLAATKELHRLEIPAPNHPQWLSASQMAALAMGPWSGNIRALGNAANHIAISSRYRDRAVIDEFVAGMIRTDEPGVVDVDAVTPLPVNAPGSATKIVGREIDDETLLAALKRAAWSPTAAAAALGVDRGVVTRRMKAHPEILRATDLPMEELLKRFDDCGRDLDKLAAELKVSKRSLKLRLG